ncbi:hypothetical protein V8B55DRAFT_1509213 [Mucor lusitanicus]|uniref:Uncharacterized protein n=1 Tax=Mucor lusitanicus CBS 277.49 TaxID=747725 RepID=A0A168PW90_MUCCL|nr:hypothetical protein MUCCIDRAFT_76764 [Mucor lusitanicus CBS 277.49]
MTKEHFISTDMQQQDVNHADIESDEQQQQQKRTSWCIESDDDEQRLRQELIQRATARLRRRMLEQGLQDVMRQVVSLQTQLETLRVDATTTIDTVSTIFDESKTAEGTQKMNRQMDILEKRLESHRMGLVQLQEQQQQKSVVDQPASMLTSEAMQKSDSNLTAMSMSRLSSLSLMSSIFGRSSFSSAATSRATSVSGGVDQHEHFKKQIQEQQQQQQQDPFESLSALEDDDNISHIESIGNSDWRSATSSSVASAEDHPFYDLAGKRSFGAGSFCGSVYHDNQQDPVTVPAPCNNSAEIRSRRRQRRQRHKQQLEQLQHQFEDDASVISDDLSTFSSISGLSMVKNNEVYLQHPLSPTTPPPHCTGSFFDQIQPYPMMNSKKDPMQAWLSSHDDNDFSDMAWENTLYSQRNVLDEAMSFLDELSENGSDGGFRQDVYLLLENPDLCCRPLSEIETKMNELRRQDTKQAPPSLTDFMLKDVLWLLKPSAWCQLAMKYSSNLIYNLTCSSLQWCRFLSVLAAAVVISILKGPEDIVRRSVY